MITKFPSSMCSVERNVDPLGSRQRLEPGAQRGAHRSVGALLVGDRQRLVVNYGK